MSDLVGEVRVESWVGREKAPEAIAEALRAELDGLYQELLAELPTWIADVRGGGS